MESHGTIEVLKYIEYQRRFRKSARLRSMPSVVNELPRSQNDSTIQIEDIEDMGRSAGAEEHASFSNRTTPRQLLKSNFLSEHHNVDVEDHKGSAPGTQKIFLKTYGCSHNVSDSEYMAGF